eukprot:scaffold1243_cov52-Cyclotella_meneghiniana.AAC.1
MVARNSPQTQQPRRRTTTGSLTATDNNKNNSNITLYRDHHVDCHQLFFTSIPSSNIFGSSSLQVNAAH